MRKIIAFIMIICAFVFGNGLTFTVKTGTVFAADTGEIGYGDINLDGDVTLADAHLSLRAALGIDALSETMEKIVDVDGNQRFNLEDVQCILKRALRIIERFPAQEQNETSESPSASNMPAPTETSKPQEGKTLIVYFSWSSSGNTEKMAKAIQEQTNGTIYKLEPQNPYPEEYTKCTEVALEERDGNARPAIKNPLVSLEGYDRILIGYPIWWHTAPMIIGTFLESYDLSGLDIYPFSQSASMNNEQFENSMEFIRESAGGGVVHPGLFARTADSDAIASYLAEQGLLENQ